MPLVRIELQEGRTPAAVRAIADAVHDAIVSEYRIPVRDRFQIVTERPAGSIIAEDAGLGFDRTDGVVVIPAHMTEDVARDAAAQERIEEFLKSRVEQGAPLFGTYPPNEETKAAYEAWRRQHS